MGSRRLSIAAKKAYGISYQATAKLYLDMYVLLSGGVTLQQIIKEAEKKFGGLFSEKLFLAQLVYFGEISATDLKKVIFVKGHRPTLPQLKKFFEGVVSSRL